MSDHPAPANPERRGFFEKLFSIVVGTVLGLVPLVSGLLVWLDPLRRKTQAGAAIRVAMLEAVPKDGVPRKFPVIASRTDAWNKFPRVPVGAVYLRRTGEKTVEALNVICPHAGCFVDYLQDKSVFLCPCHNSTFGLDGQINDPRSPSPRALDGLEVEIRRGNEIWVKFVNFRPGTKEKVPVA
jgi:menaquinol-cytochrome c reductase iron-sulfur subunit